VAENNSMKQCYLCGEILVRKKNLSKDHVPPDCIFPSEKPRNLITVPCCTICNGKYGRLDERMRNFFAILADKNSREIGDIARRVVLRSSKLSAEFYSRTRPYPWLADSAGDARRLFFFDDEELNPWLVRIAKGLFYHRNGFRLSDTAVFQVGKLPEVKPPRSEAFPLEEGLQLRPHFAYGVLQDVEKAGTDFWVLVFYDHLVFTVDVENVNRVPTSKRAEPIRPMGVNG
jgi:hypothetical protein